MEHTSLENVVYVTAIYDTKQLEDFLPFITTSMKFLVYTDIENLSVGTNKVIHLPRTELKAFTKSPTVLPQYRNKEKDTLEYLQFGNAKTEFLYRAKQTLPAKTYVWIDSSILTTITQKERFFQSLSSVSEFAVEGKVVIPGGFTLDMVNFKSTFLCPLWRFCGSVVIASASSIENFYTLYNQELEKCFQLNTITWEGNLWAIIERNTPDLIQWYHGDMDDTIIPESVPKKVSEVKQEQHDVRIIFLTMIKNESAVIKRCIESVVSLCDAICVCDTGSTDSTIEVLTGYFKDLTIPTKIYTHEWKHFGHNRTESFNSVVDFCKELGWNPNKTYALLLDADMQLSVRSFDKNSLVTPGYSIIQRSPGIEYHNTRFIQIGFPWKCTGVTHEYWDGYYTDKLEPESIYINDVGDGGCKADKFERDVRLLEGGLKEDPTNERYMFYLAQSYRDSGNIDKSIEYYMKRVDAGGWDEEIWFSMYSLMKLYGEKGDYPMMEMWGMKAYNYRKERIENILYLVRHFRDKREYYKAWHYWNLGNGVKKPDDLLFVEPEAYTNAFDRERIIIQFYVYPERKTDILNHAIKYYNMYDDMLAYSNIKWFVDKIPSKLHEHTFYPIGDYTPTSISFCRENGKYRVNVRYVNYRIQADGSYMMYENGILRREHAVRTENYECIMDSKFNIMSPLQKMTMTDVPLHNVHIKGVEDIRLFTRNNELMYIGTSLENSYNCKIRQHMGRYNTQKHILEENRSLRPPTETECEKNWIPYKEDKFIYSWHPFQVGSLHSDSLAIDSKQETPLFFKHMRGSSNLVEDNGYLYGITHCVMYEQPRKYYHMVVKINTITDKVEAYTNPFYFMNNAIEYCLGMEKRGNIYYVFVSQNDTNPVFIEFNDSDLNWKNI